jgi:chromate reductase
MLLLRLRNSWDNIESGKSIIQITIKMKTSLKVLAMAGSNRRYSYNRALLKASQNLAPGNLEIELYDLADIPMFNEDLESDPPAIVVEFKKRIAEADGLLFAAPEYNYSLSAILKNAIDWASRPAKASVLDMKPTGIMGGTIGMSGTIRSQQHLRQVALWTNMMDMKKPEVLVARVHEKFDKDLNLTDEPLREHLKKFLSAFENWISMVKNAESMIETNASAPVVIVPSREIHSDIQPSEAELPEVAEFWAKTEIE